MTSLYGVTRSFDYGYLQSLLYGMPPPESDDCSGAGRSVPPCAQPLRSTRPLGIAGWLAVNRPRWYALIVRAQLAQYLDTDLTAMTFFLPPDEAIDRYGLDQWNFGYLRRMLAGLIVDRPLSPTYLRRSLGYKLYLMDAYDPVTIFSMDGRHFYFQDPAVEILDGVGIPVSLRTNTGFDDRGLTSHWIHHLSDLPSLDGSDLTTYAQ